jgi:hypothetical protein
MAGFSSSPETIGWSAWLRRGNAAAAYRVHKHLQREHLARGPYFFPDLARATESDERAAIEGGQIRATRVDYVGTLR